MQIRKTIDKRPSGRFVRIPSPRPTTEIFGPETDGSQRTASSSPTSNTAWSLGYRQPMICRAARFRCMASHPLHLGSALTLCLLLLGVTSGSPVPTPSPRTHGTPIRPAAPPDTLTTTIPKGTPLVRSLPDTVGGTPVTQYAVLNGPALCGTAGRSFTWIPRDAAPGPHPIRLKANHPDASPDTLILRVNVES